MSERPNIYTPFLRRFTDEIQMERGETIALYNNVRAKHLASVWATPDIVQRISNQIAEITSQLAELPQCLPLAQSLDRCLSETVALEKTVVSFPEIDWAHSLLSMQEGVDLRRFLRAKQHFLANEDRVYGELQTALGNIFGGIIQKSSAHQWRCGQLVFHPTNRTDAECRRRCQQNRRHPDGRRTYSMRLVHRVVKSFV